ncbi:RNA degradosome polyphosphate kinase [Clostridium beijerinckii]|uniref:Polyphosphate kinase n=1 Tax=Clostridium beijerinckii TaxID=1520 RepID=A0AB74VP74_CLOBE|nr:RNA degradosome polyphosphate kinase [Clostridium beijerinckii]NRZ26925.1 polyphosphate kinase [Clostridium beijerinckii]NYB97279.1 polyphosphate kinase [Clostridium beijerinckii]OOM19797.1 polyphosphate kinase [Clostridium beijerinckii]QUN37551.1 RNA degradosome polyphosphate kinase [Clostridium beijerinckii]SQB11951.1 polyphosphate kinase [Clostridium beijerinckii]
MDENYTYDNYENFFNRELSWLEFNQRVLDEAKDNTNPLLERLKFLSISSSNLDEFFMVRIGSLYSQIQAGFDEREVSGLTPSEQISKILYRVREMVKDQYHTYDHLYDHLGSRNIRIFTYDMLNEEQLEFINDYYKNILYPVLTPMVIDSGRPFPLLLNKTLNIGVILKESKSEQELFATIQVPSVLGRLVPMPGGIGENFVLLEDVIKNHLKELFGFKVLTTACYRITKNADLSLNEEGAEDLLETIEESLKQRRWGLAVRLEIEETNDTRIINKLEQEFEISEDQISCIKGPIDLTFINKLYSIKGYSELKFEQIKSLQVKELQEEDIFQEISKKDIFLHHPYESFSLVVKLVETAAQDEKVLAIKQTLYRVSGNSPIIAALSKAAENGKQVTVLVELKARFDEENNIHWARQLEKAGCHVIYGVIGLKTHSKILLIVRKEKKGIKRYVHLGTGNYNDVTAKFYTDIGIITSKPEYGEDASVIFNMLSGYFKPENMSKITIAPYGLRKKLEHLVERETEHAKNGKKAKIIAKMNSLVDRKLMIALYKASQAGVKVELIVRGICSLRPGVKGLSDNITVRSIVGRYLEHSRIYYFYNNGKEDTYISSADWMYRNLDKRVETMTVIEDNLIKKELKEMLELYIKDNVKSRILLEDGSYTKIKSEGKIVNAQKDMIEICKKFNQKS